MKNETVIWVYTPISLFKLFSISLLLFLPLAIDESAMRQGNVAKQFRSLAWDATTGLVSFEYEPSFLINNLDISLLKMPIDGAERRVFSFTELRSTSYSSV